MCLKLATRVIVLVPAGTRPRGHHGVRRPTMELGGAGARQISIISNRISKQNCTGNNLIILIAIYYP